MKDPGNGLGYIAIFFLFGGPILGFSSLDSFMDLEEAANICCGGIIIGIVLSLVSLVKSGTYQDEVKKAYRAVQAEAMIQPPPACPPRMNGSLLHRQSRDWLTSPPRLLKMILLSYPQRVD